ncbi:MAG: hypothetical protein JWO06_1349 [Bacteroidota bacterium]|nr:hypothetical protein [Bacteroidota bacterium]
MKRIQVNILMIAITLISAIPSCKKSNSTTPSCGNGLLCATVDGTGYTASAYNTSTTGGFFGIGGTTTYNGSYAQLIPVSGTVGGYNLVVVGNNGTPNASATYQLDFTIKQLPTNGATYSTAAGSASFDYYAGSTSNQLHYVSDSSHTGSVTISNIDTVNNLVSGTFSYAVVEAPGNNYTPTTHNITSGSFTGLFLRR